MCVIFYYFFSFIHFQLMKSKIYLTNNLLSRWPKGESALLRIKKKKNLLQMQKKKP